MEPKSIDPGKRMFQLALNEAISSKFSLNSAFKRELDQKKRYRKKANEKESLVTKEMAEIYRSMEKERDKNSYNSKTNSSNKQCRQKYFQDRMFRSMPDPQQSRNNFEMNNNQLFDDSNVSTRELISKQEKSVLFDLNETHSSESLIVNEDANEEFYISPPYYPDSFSVPTNPNIYPENTISSLYVENKSNCVPSTPNHFEQHISLIEEDIVEKKSNHVPSTPAKHFSFINSYFNPENQSQCIDFNHFYKSTSTPNLVPSRDILLTSNNPEKTTVEKNLENNQTLFFKSKKRSSVCKHKPLSPKMDDKNDYINDLIDSFISKKSSSSSTEKSIDQEQQTSKVEDAACYTDIPSSLVEKAPIHVTQNTHNLPKILLNFKNNACKNEIDMNNANLAEINDDGMLSSNNEISVTVLCEFFKLQALLS